MGGLPANGRATTPSSRLDATRAAPAKPKIELPKPMAPGGNASAGALLGQTTNLPQRPVQPSDSKAAESPTGAGGAVDLSQLGAAAGQ